MAIDARVTLRRQDFLGMPFGPEAILKAMERYRIDTAVVCSGMAVDADFRRGNAELIEVINADPRLYGCVVLNPAYPEESVETMRALMNKSRVVAMGLFIGASRPHPNIDDCRDMLNSYRRYTKPVMLHTPNAAAVVAAAEIAKEFPGIKFILGSMGGADWPSVLPFAKQLNLVPETSGSFDSEKIAAVAEAYGPHRVIFGSDFPRSDIAAMLALVQSSGLPKESLAMIVNDNAKKLFGI